MNDKRRGAVVVEMAIAAPLLLMFVFAGIEFARVNMIRNTIENATYTGARQGILPGATVAKCEAVTQDLLDIIGVKDSTVNVVILDEEVTVTVEVPMTIDNGYITPKYYLGAVLNTSITLPREVKN